MKKTYISPSVKFMVCDMKSSLLEEIGRAHV